MEQYELHPGGKSTLNNGVWGPNGSPGQVALKGSPVQGLFVQGVYSLAANFGSGHPLIGLGVYSLGVYSLGVYSLGVYSLGLPILDLGM